MLRWCFSGGVLVAVFSQFRGVDGVDGGVVVFQKHADKNNKHTIKEQTENRSILETL